MRIGSCLPVIQERRAARPARSPCFRKAALFSLALWLCAAAPVHGQGAAQAFGPADEERDFGVRAETELRSAEHSAPTPRLLPGGRTIGTAALRELIVRSEAGRRPLLMDVLGGEGHASLPGTVWLPDAGRGSSFDDALQARLARTLQVLSGGDRSRPLVFFCQGPRCWLSYNAALRALKLGYGEVYWYRGGIEAWLAAGGSLLPPRVTWERPQLP